MIELQKDIAGMSRTSWTIWYKNGWNSTKYEGVISGQKMAEEDIRIRTRKFAFPAKMQVWKH